MTLLATLSNDQSQPFVLGLGCEVEQDKPHRTSRSSSRVYTAEPHLLPGPDHRHGRDHQTSEHTAERSHGIEIPSADRPGTRPQRAFQWPDVGAAEEDGTGQDEMFAFDDDRHAGQDSLLRGVGAQFGRETGPSPRLPGHASVAPRKDSGVLSARRSHARRVQGFEELSVDALLARSAEDRISSRTSDGSRVRSTKE
ncbi:hypothetical protein Tdes44962_MAKER09619 [Teratosphaeria destructans]|uniref:Uncharacterized protein n=1 Tax=Teratosphaeria destructans TaxID=418781 RepID=A0A9W7SSL6_9PEZI|nr:hypothetical protein Tdes44962_MAKER09619 [Teratosphaeria destructans]